MSKLSDASIVGKIEAAVIKKGGTAAAFDLLNGDAGVRLMDTFADALVQEEMRSRNSFPVPFTPGLSWKERIERGKFDTVDKEVWEYIDKFEPVVDEDPTAVNVSLEHYNRYISSSDAESEMAKVRRCGISSARFLHLCEHFPALQKQSPLVCLKVICTGRHGNGRVLYADVTDDGQRELWLYYRDHAWRGLCRFPSVPQGLSNA